MRGILTILAAAGVLVAAFLPAGCSTGHLPETLPTQTQQAQPHARKDALDFPYTIPESGLIIEKVVSYSGDYVEDETDEPVSDITGLMLYNPTGRMVEFGGFALELEGKQQYFFVYCLPPESRCLILEKSRQPYSDKGVTQCRQLSLRWDYQDLCRQQVSYVGFAQELTVVNLSQTRQQHICIRYKRYEQQEAYYLGGVAYSAYAFRLRPQEQRTLLPAHYHAGSARVVSIRQDG